MMIGTCVAPAPAAQAAAHLEAVRPGEHEVQEDQRGAFGLGALEGILPALRLADGVALLLEVKAEEVADVLLVLDDEKRPFDGHVAGLSTAGMTGP
jgi:hypothetical protein